MLDTAAEDEHSNGAQLQLDRFSGGHLGPDLQLGRYDTPGCEDARASAGANPAAGGDATAVSLLHQAAAANGVVIPPRPPRKSATPVIDYRF